MGAPYSLSVVVGIDGSRAAVDAALWAVDEAVSRDIPLRLVYAIDSTDNSDTDTEGAARKLASAELAVRYAFTAVESTDKPVKIEVEILQGHPTRVLMEASRAAEMLCVGSIGLKHFTEGRVGSTATTLVARAHCPVAMIRRQGGATSSLVPSPENRVSRAAGGEASSAAPRQSQAPLRRGSTTAALLPDRSGCRRSCG